MADKYDVIVVGGGSNSLTTAAYLCKIGKRVLVLEKNDHCGGGVVSVAPAPGFIGDPHATGFITCVPNPAISHDELGLQSRFGLEWAWAEASFSTVFDDGTGLITYQNLDKSCESIAKISARDAEAYRAFVADCREYLPLLIKSFYCPPLPFPGFVSLLDQSVKGRRLLTAMLESAYDVVGELFESPELKMHLLKWVGEMMIHPETKGTGIVPFLLMGIAHSYRTGAVIGGSQNLTRALERCIAHYGGTIRLNADVTKINLSAGKATGVTLQGGEIIEARDAVVANIHPWDLGEMLPGMDTQVAASARQVKLSSHGAINQQYALSEAPIWKAGPEYAPSMLVECMHKDFPAMRAKFDEYKFGRLTNDHLSPLIAVQSNHDKTRAPPGQAAMYLYHFAPMVLEHTGLEGWDEIKMERADAIYDEMCKYTTNMDRSKIIGRYVQSPLDHHRHSKMMRHGDIFGIGSFNSQFFGRRPLPELAQYKVPGLSAFYLCGCTQHPGGTVTLGGRATAMRMLMDWRMDLSSAFAVI